MKNLNAVRLDEALRLLESRLRIKGSGPLRLVVCGGSALIAAGLITRATQDVDIVALMDGREQLVNPNPLPAVLLEAASEVAQILGLKDDWLNNGPSRGEGGLFQMGRPKVLSAAFPEKITGGTLWSISLGGRIKSISSFMRQWIEEATISPTF